VIFYREVIYPKGNNERFPETGISDLFFGRHLCAMSDGGPGTGSE